MAIYYHDNGQRSYNSQTKHADRMIPPSSSQSICEHTLCAWEPRNRPLKKSDFVIFP